MQDRKFDIAYIRRYVRGDLSPKEMHALERAAEADEMLMDLILGVETEYAQQLPVPTDNLQRHIDDRIRAGKTKVRRPWIALSAAASLFAVMGIAVYLYLGAPFQHAQQEKIATEEVDRPTDGQHDSLTGRQTNSPAPSLAQNKPTGAAKAIAAKSKRKKPPLDTTDTGLFAAKELPEGIGLDSSALLLAQTPDKQLDAIDMIGAQAHQRRVANVQTRSLRIRGMSSGTNHEKKGTVVFGKILDSQTNRPLPHVVINDQISQKTVHADSLGRFLLVSDSGRVNLAMHHLGYEPKQRLLATTSELEIRLHPEQNSLDEVVVAGRGKKVSTPKSPRPNGGWGSFDNYMAAAAKEAGLSFGNVVLRFEVDPQGNPENIQIKKSVSAMHDATAVRFLNDGPRWERGRRNKPVEVTVRFGQ
ncbi:carboxypeptidase-like regulatory domain-containing protein [Sphingobacterium griseoflavum]|uniref:TonB C-terminal domain-containing protein n=1 Tax=Sphingobacterium griseoflavum TaxID=1474952 RepID=A0ABQ3I0C8_9SPHI|nr:carboxypeptidase-like regulatory domain-containing protein [Sphingobacterium griseoflavum]GHE43824.1 hypothetical protein GCM10017764_28930 [Sphingobacterium griseoflavum]